jgi:signal transduction histidine kinase
LIVSGSIYLTGQVNSDFFLLYFLVIMTAALSETPKALFWSGGLVCLVYLAMVERLGGIDSLLKTEVLIRLPFFWIVSLFYGHLSQRARLEERQRHNLEKKLSLASEVRRYSRFFSSALSRKKVLKGLVQATSRLCRTESVFVFSRGEKKVVVNRDGQTYPQLTIRTLLKELDRLSGFHGKDSAILPMGNGSTAMFCAGFTVLPVSVLNGSEPTESGKHKFGKSGSDLYLAIEGKLNEELFDNTRLLVLNAVLALKNAGQYQALLNEVEKRRSLAEELRQALDSKSAFVANISHELRTPVNALIGFGELLLEGGYGKLEDEKTRVVNRMVQNAVSLRELINDLLDFSKLEAFAVKVRPEPKKLKVFLEELLENSHALLRDKAVVLHGETNLPDADVVCDWRLMRQIALNLTSNAIKFTPVGEVNLRLDYIDSVLELEVTDSGIGMTDEELSQIFQPFKQVDNAYTKRFAGTGLGLSITKREIELLKGEIKVQSTPGRGSKFIVRIPATLNSLITEKPNYSSKIDSLVSST